jgi:hypothetical protein
MDEIKSLSSAYAAIKETLKPLIDKGVLAQDYPHDAI